MFYIEKLSLKTRILTGLAGGTVCTGVMWALYYFMKEAYDRKLFAFYFIGMSLFFGLALKWKSQNKAVKK